MSPVDILTALSSIVSSSVEAATAVTSAGSRPDQAELARRGLRFLIGAYTVIWVILAAYMLTLSVRIRRLSQQVRRLKERITSGT